MTEQHFSFDKLQDFLTDAKTSGETEHLMAKIDTDVLAPMLDERIALEDRSLMIATWLNELAALYEQVKGSQEESDKELQWLFLAVAHVLTNHSDWINTGFPVPNEYEQARNKLPLSRLAFLGMATGLPRA